MKVKFCGLTREEDIEYANELMPEYIGFVFWEKSSRNITPEKAKDLRGELHPDIKAVGVFVNEDMENVLELYKQGIIDVAQLHGNEDDIYIKKLQKQGVPIIKTYKIKSKDDLKLAADSIADYILLDAGMGQGKTFNWDLLETFNRKYFLAGGLDTENITEVVERIKPYAVDVSSGIEVGGKKNQLKMREFMKAVRGQ
ncbi:MAG: phosphoribosylanthranilate isomerase [Lachnospiraceae bacterium]|nr:phosphoribosylanthranilate isomerase [Lachnospiraceae bacterium]